LTNGSIVKPIAALASTTESIAKSIDALGSTIESIVKPIDALGLTIASFTKPIAPFASITGRIVEIIGLPAKPSDPLARGKELESFEEHPSTRATRAVTSPDLSPGAFGGTFRGPKRDGEVTEWPKVPAC
jgi:hypothetical protein